MQALIAKQGLKHPRPTIWTIIRIWFSKESGMSFFRHLNKHAQKWQHSLTLERYWLNCYRTSGNPVHSGWMKLNKHLSYCALSSNPIYQNSLIFEKACLTEYWLSIKGSTPWRPQKNLKKQGNLVKYNAMNFQKQKPIAKLIAWSKAHALQKQVFPAL